MAKETKKTKVEEAKLPQQSVAEFAAEVKDYTLEQLEKLEQEIVAEADKHQNEALNAMLPLQEEGRKEAFAAVRMMLSTMDVQWQMTLGLKEMYEFFDPEKETTEIVYPVLDTVLTTLINRTYKGYDEWCAAVNISTYFDSVRERFAEIRATLFVDAQKHNHVVDRINKMREAAAAKAEVEEAALQA